MLARLLMAAADRALQPRLAGDDVIGWSGFSLNA
jgi:hypothetical protein